MKLSNSQITKLLAQYEELVDQSFDIFEVEVELIFSSKKSVTPSIPTDNVVDLNSINPRRRPTPSEYDRGDDKVIITEVTDTARLKIYWNAEEWRNLYGYTSVPENQVMFLAKLEIAKDLNQAKQVRYTDVKGNVYVFSRVSRAVPFGFEKNRYCSSIWEQTT